MSCEGYEFLTMSLSSTVQYLQYMKIFAFHLVIIELLNLQIIEEAANWLFVEKGTHGKKYNSTHFKDSFSVTFHTNKIHATPQAYVDIRRQI